MTPRPDPTSSPLRAAGALLGLLGGLLLGACGPSASAELDSAAAAARWVDGYREAYPASLGPVGPWPGLQPTTPERAFLARNEEQLLALWQAEPSPPLGRDLGALYTRAQEHERGMAWLVYVFDEVDADARVWLWLGANRLSAGALDEAHDLLEYAEVLQPGDPRIPRYLGEVALRQGDTAGAEAALRRAVTLDSDYLEALWALSGLLDEQDRTAEAEPFLERLVQLDPEHAPALYLLARLAADAGDEPRAELLRALHARAVMLDDLGLARSGVARPEQLVSLGIALLEQGDPESAGAEFLTVLELDDLQPNTLAMARVGLCDALFRMGEYEGARDLLATIEANHPEHGMLPSLREIARAHPRPNEPRTSGGVR